MSTSTPVAPSTSKASAALRRPRSRGALRGRPALYTSYKQDMSPWDTPAKRAWTLALVAAVFLAPLFLGSELESRFTILFATAIGAIGINLVTGYAGQVSLGHAFFLGVGAYTAAALGGDPEGRTIGMGLPMLVWLPASGLMAGFVGFLVAPVASRLKGLYLAVVTLGLVFIGEHVFRDWVSLTGGPGTGRSAPPVTLFGARLDKDGPLFGMELEAEVKMYFFALVVLVALALLAKNIARSKVGRAFAAVRDRDLAAEVMGVPLARTKVTAFTLSSAYAGIAGALLATTIGFIEPGSFNLLVSLEYLAMVIIGGLATISGSIVGAVFIVLVPRLIEPLTASVNLFGFNSFELQTMLNGVLIIVFIILEPRGLFGLWLRIRNYWKAWPFSY